jgi:hypothetical protein
MKPHAVEKQHRKTRKENMRILITLLSLGLISCATVAPTLQGPEHTQLTASNIEKTCEPVENWNVQVLPMSVWALRFNNCVGIADFLVIITPIGEFSRETRSLSAQLTSMHYTNYLKRESGNSTIWKLKLVKNEIRNYSNNSQEIFYYIISSPTANEVSDS